MKNTKKSKSTYGTLSFFFGSFGFHNFYVGQKKQGILKLVFAIMVIALAMLRSRGASQLPIEARENIYNSFDYIISYIYFYIASFNIYNYIQVILSKDKTKWEDIDNYGLILFNTASSILTLLMCIKQIIVLAKY
ncbi:MAG: NINE protein [Alphaproteobacteria bacterium]